VVQERAGYAPLYVAILALILNGGALAYLGLQTRHLRDTNRFHVLEAVHQQLKASSRLPESTDGENHFYALRRRFKTSPDAARNPPPGKEGYEASLAARIEVVRELDADVRRRDTQLVDHVVNAYNRVGDLIDNRLIEARPILATYHVSIIREMFIAEPYLWYRMLFEEPERLGMRPLRLGEMARAYNDMNPVHREEIVFRGDERYGSIFPRPSPSRPRRAWWWVRVRTVGYPTITSRSKVEQRALAGRLRDAVGGKYPLETASSTSQ
jgi:hypothetical protein